MDVDSGMEIIELMDIVLLLPIMFEMFEELHKLHTRKCWVQELFLDRKTEGFFEKNVMRLRIKNSEMFRKLTRMQPTNFDVLLNLLKEGLYKNSIRTPISPECRLFLTLIYLAHGESKQYLSATFKIGITTVRRITLETCQFIWDTLNQIYLSPPNKHEWERIGADFKNIWNFPNCVGAIDGKHVNLRCPPNSESTYYNYKATFSIVLLAVCDANYTFTLVDIGAYGSQSDGGILQASKFGKCLLAGTLDLPDARPLEENMEPFPHYIVGDAAFPLKRNIMRPYPGLLLDEKKQNFNKRLSRARRTIENTFGILTARWRILRQTLELSDKSAQTVVQAAVVLHNFLKLNKRPLKYYIFSIKLNSY